MYSNRLLFKDQRISWFWGYNDGQTGYPVFIAYLLRVVIGGGGGLVTKSCQTIETPCAVARQAALSMEFSRQEYWSGVAISFSRGSSQPRD